MVKKLLAGLLGGTGIILSAWILILAFPQPLFADSYRHENLTLYQDRPIDGPAAERVLSEVQQKLARWPGYDKDHAYRLFICQSDWRQRLLFNRVYGAGGVVFTPIPNAFVRDADLSRNRLFSPKGPPVPAPRTLAYYLSHEIGHVLTGHRLGTLRYYRLPLWLREGVAEYYAREPFDYAAERQAWLHHEKRMNPAASGRYDLYRLQVGYLLAEKRIPLERLLAEAPAPPAQFPTNHQAGEPAQKKPLR